MIKAKPKKITLSILQSQPSVTIHINFNEKCPINKAFSHFAGKTVTVKPMKWVLGAASPKFTGCAWRIENGGRGTESFSSPAGFRERRISSLSFEGPSPAGLCVCRAREEGKKWWRKNRTQDPGRNSRGTEEFVAECRPSLRAKGGCGYSPKDQIERERFWGHSREMPCQRKHTDTHTRLHTNTLQNAFQQSDLRRHGKLALS